MNCLLSIAIPTWNRDKFLDESLKALISQITELKVDIEIVISDNASTDSTQNLIQQLMEQYSFIRYYRNSENLGLDKNVGLAVERATGKYVWLFGDDDLPAPQAVAQIYQKLREYKDKNLALLFINRSLHNSDFTTILKDRKISQDSDIYCANGRELFDLVNEELLTASCLVLKKELCFGEFTDKFLTGYYCCTLALSLEALSKGSGYFLSNPLIMYREGDKSSWSFMWPTIFAYYTPMIARYALALGYQKNALNKITDKMEPFLYDWIMYWKFYSLKEVKESIRWIDLISIYKQKIWFWRRCFWLIIIPDRFGKYFLLWHGRTKRLWQEINGKPIQYWPNIVQNLWLNRSNNRKNGLKS